METTTLQRPAEYKLTLQRAIGEVQNALLRLQHPEGYWAGPLEADVSVGAGYLPLMLFITGQVPNRRAAKIAAWILSKQRSDGSWSSYFGGPGDLNVSVQAYFSLKLAGIAPEQPGLQAARSFIRRSGGIEAVNTITRIWLALFGQASWDAVPNIPPELILLPAWLPINIYEFASWSRATIVALMAIVSLRPVCPVPAGAGLGDLSVTGEGHPGEGRRRRQTKGWEAFFLRLDRLLKAWERTPVKPLRRKALDRIEEWILAHQERDGSWGGILLPWVYSLIALKSLGRPAEDPAILKGIRGLDAFFIEEEGGLWLQPATSPVWDTAWSVIALGESGLPADHPALQSAARWLLKQEIRQEGDWAVKNPRVRPGCWAFEFVNRFYPDLDDTAVVPRALLRVRLEEAQERDKQAAIRRAASWIRAMQCKDGGWAAFDRDNTRRILAHIPYGDFMTPLDPASPDVTAHVLELLSELGGSTRCSDRCISAGTGYLRRQQQADGSWYGRWGVNYLYGTGLSLAALAATGVRAQERHVQQALDWLETCQNPDGGWGESCRSYDEPDLRGQGPSTASQTAWALLGLSASTGAAAGRPSALRSLQRGVEYLLRSQRPDGGWQEQEYTGTGFPRAFYLRYDLYRLYFPLLALARCSAAPTSGSGQEQLMSQIPPSQRVLLVSHCLRKSSGCRAKQGTWGLECRHCTDSCAVNKLSDAARRRGYKGVCIAPGGSMALSFIRRTQPRGIVAVACRKELEEGIQAVSDAVSASGSRPAILAVPLTKDGCVDTEVDLPRALQLIELGGADHG